MESDELRKKIDDIDTEMRSLFSERLRVFAELAKADAKNGSTFIDPDLDRKKLDAALGKSDPPLRGYIADFYLRVFELSRSYLGGVIGDTDKPVYDPPTFGAGLPDDPYSRTRNASIQSAGVNVKNIALIGMPGCGKTMIGRNLAELLGWEFCDIDEYIAKKIGKETDKIRAESGENAYHDIETEAISEIVKGRGFVIATGDNIIKREVNKEILRKNSTVVFIDRTPSELLSDGSAKYDLFSLKTIYLKRLPVYLDWCECEISARGGAQRTAQAIKELLQRKV